MHLLPRSTLLRLSAGEAGPGASPGPMDSGYWLHHCDGFRVDGPHGRIGVVDHVEDRLGVDAPDVVTVAAGLWRIHSTRIPLTDVVEVQPGRRRLVVRDDDR
jgi:hypothetical protein